MERAGSTQRCETLGGPPRGSEFGPGGHSAEMIGDSCSYANNKIFVKRVREHLLPPAQRWSPSTPGTKISSDGSSRRAKKPRQETPPAHWWAAAVGRCPGGFTEAFEAALTKVEPGGIEPLAPCLQSGGTRVVKRRSRLADRE
jgi:hypothetical protein